MADSNPSTYTALLGDLSSLLDDRLRPSLEEFGVQCRDAVSADKEEEESVEGSDDEEEGEKKYGALEKAEMLITAAYAVNSLFYMYVRLQGHSLASEHPVHAELARVRRYMQRLKSVTETASASESAKGPALRVDREAAARFIRAGVGGAGNAVDEEATAESRAPKRSRSSTKSNSSSGSKGKGSGKGKTKSKAPKRKRTTG